MKKLKVGIIGMGNVTEKLHVPGILRCESTELTAICDQDAKRLLQMGDMLGLKSGQLYADHKTLLASGRVDAVIISTPNHTHCRIAMDAVLAGIPFAVEKPVGINSAEVGTLLMANSAKTPGMVCFSYRYLRAVRRARRMIQEGLLGNIRHVYAEYLQDWGNREDVPLTWRYQVQLAGSGVSGDLGIHQIDMVRFLTGKEFVHVVADAPTIQSKRCDLSSGEDGAVDVDDCCHVLCRLDNSASVILASTRFAFGCGNEQRIEVYGSKGSLRIGLRDGMDWLETCFEDSRSGRNQMVNYPVADDPQADQTQSFCDVVNGCGDGLTATLEDGYQAQKVLDAILDSVKTGQWIRLKGVLE